MDDAVSYYYQIRQNLVHRGKGVVGDHDQIEKSLIELVAIFCATLTAAFEESKWPSAGGRTGHCAARMKPRHSTAN
jgi:hypothetical protein